MSTPLSPTSTRATVSLTPGIVCSRSAASRKGRRTSSAWCSTCCTAAVSASTCDRCSFSGNGGAPSPGRAPRRRCPRGWPSGVRWCNPPAAQVSPMCGHRTNRCIHSAVPEFRTAPLQAASVVRSLTTFDASFMRQHPLPNPHSAQPAPSDTTSTAPTRTLRICPPRNPASSAPGRTPTGDRSRGEGTPEPPASAPASLVSVCLDPLRQPAGQDRLDRAVADIDNPRAVHPPPAAAIARRIAARHANPDHS